MMMVVMIAEKYSEEKGRKILLLKEPATFSCLLCLLWNHMLVQELGLPSVLNGFFSNHLLPQLPANTANQCHPFWSVHRTLVTIYAFEQVKIWSTFDYQHFKMPDLFFCYSRYKYGIAYSWTHCLFVSSLLDILVMDFSCDWPRFGKNIKNPSNSIRV